MRSSILPHILALILMVGTLGIAPCAQADFASASEMENTREVRAFLITQILDSLQGRDWLVSRTHLSYGAELVRQAAARGITLVLIDTPFPGLPEEAQAQIRRLGDDAVTAATITPAYFAYHWLQSAPDSARAHLALYDHPEIWRTGQSEFIPSGIVYLGVPSLDEARLHLEKRYADALTSWDEVGEFLIDSEISSATPLATSLREELRRRISTSANELGVLLELADKPTEAFEAYSRAYRMSPTNVSALMNKASLVKRGNQTGSQAELIAELNRHNAAAVTEDIRWNTGLLCGAVVHPEDFVEMGWLWALSAVPESATERLELGMKSAPEHLAPQLTQMVRAAQDRQIGMVKHAQQIAAMLNNPAQRPGIALAMHREALLMHHPEATINYWRQEAEAAGASSTEIALSTMAVMLAQGNQPAAYKALTEALAKNEKDWVVRRNLLSMHFLAEDHESLAASAAFIRAHSDEAPAGLADYAESLVLSLDAKPLEALPLITKAPEANPNELAYLDSYLRLVMQCGMPNPEAIAKHAETLLSLNPTHAFANYILGSIAYAKANYETAQKFLQRSVEIDPQEYALNDYACTLSILKLYDQAISVAEFALQRNPNSPTLLDTYADALIGAGQLDKAEEMVNKTIENIPAEADSVVHSISFLRHAHIQYLRGNYQKAMKYMIRISHDREKFGTVEASLFDDLNQKLLDTIETPAP